MAILSDAADLVWHLSSLGNNAALIAVHAGCPAAAFGLCQSQLDWIRGIVDWTEDRSLAYVAVQPWVNIGRLWAQQGQTDAALAQFEALRPALRGEALLLGGVKVPIDCWGKSHDPRMEAMRFVYDVAIIDGLRALLLGGRGAEISEYAASWQIVPGDTLELFVEEFLIVADVQARQYDDACARAIAAARRTSNWWKTAFICRFVEARLAADSSDPTGLAAGRKLAAALERVGLDERPNVSTLGVTASLVDALSRAGEASIAELARKGVRGAVLLNDEVHQHSFLTSAARVGATLDDGSDAREALAYLGDHTIYRRLRPPAAREPSFPALDRLDRDLRVIFRECRCVEQLRALLPDHAEGEHYNPAARALQNASNAPAPSVYRSTN